MILKRKTPIKTTSSRSRLIARLDKMFSRYIRLRDAFSTQSGMYVRCISCGKIIPIKESDCGHYVNRGHMATRFSEDNCHAQCHQCNRFDEGNIMGYRPALVTKIGESRVLLLESMKRETCKLSEFELKALLEEYRRKVKMLEEEKGWKWIR